MHKNTIKKIFQKHNLQEAKSITKINIGFTNIVYSVENKYIIKICKDYDNEENFEKEVFFYNLFKSKIPVPNVIVYDKSKSIYHRHFMIYDKIQGDNLYSIWHLINNEERKTIIKQICEIMKIINNRSLDEYINKFNIDPNINWHDTIINSIDRSLKEIQSKKLISQEFISAIQNFVKKNQKTLKEQKIAFVYWDAHFDNILVKDNQIIGILDFERTELSSIDFVLDIVKRMQYYPKKYMSEQSENFAKKQDYQHLMEWYKLYYPEAFEFKNLDKRLDIYSLEHDLKDIIGWPDVHELKTIVAKTIKYKIK